MDYTNLGKTGLKVSRIALGCMSYGAPEASLASGGRHAWTLNEEQSRPFLRQALDAGINFFDTANYYSSGTSEEVLGRFLKENVQRESVVIATKVWGPMRDSTKVCAACKQSSSICIRFTAGITKRPSKKLWKGCTTS